MNVEGPDTLLGQSRSDETQGSKDKRGAHDGPPVAAGRSKIGRPIILSSHRERARRHLEDRSQAGDPAKADHARGRGIGVAEVVLVSNSGPAGRVAGAYSRPPRPAAFHNPVRRRCEHFKTRSILWVMRI